MDDLLWALAELLDVFVPSSIRKDRATRVFAAIAAIIVLAIAGFTIYNVYA